MKEECTLLLMARSSEGSVSLSYLPAVPPTDEEMKLQDVAFPAETIIPLFPSEWLKEGGLRMENARVGARASSRTGERRLALMLALKAAISSRVNNRDVRAKNRRIVGNFDFIASL